MSEKNINRWQHTITPRGKAPLPWTVKSGGSFDMLDVQPIPDEMLSELAQMYSYCGTPWNCHSLPLSPTDREYMYMLYFSMQGLIARMRKAEQQSYSMLALLQEIQNGQQFTPEFCQRIDVVITQIEDSTTNY